MRIEPRFKPLPPEPATLVAEGRIVDAIKVLRESHGLGLEAAKDWVDWHIDQDPMLRVQLETQRRAARRRLFFWFVVVDVLIVGAVVYYTFFLDGPAP